MAVFSADLSPIASVQNPAFGALLLWRFVRGYQTERPGEMPFLQSLFLTLPLVLHRATMLEIYSTQKSSGLAKFVSKLSSEREKLLAIHERTLLMRDLTLDSLGIGIATRMLTVNYESGLVRANEVKVPVTPERLKHHLASAEKVGCWLARLPASLAFSLLKVEP